MTTPVQTAGPADPNAGARAKVYAGIGAVFGLLTLAQVFGLIKADQAASIKDFIDSGAGLAATFGFGFVASKTKKQVGNGTFDPPPPAPEPDPQLSTADQIVNAIPAVLQDAADKLSDVEKIKQAATDAFGNVPIVGGLAQQLIEQFTPGR